MILLVEDKCKLFLNVPRQDLFVVFSSVQIQVVTAIDGQIA